MKQIKLSGLQIGLIVRGKTSDTHNPGVMAQHADCILADGAPIGFFGGGDNPYSSGSTSGWSQSTGINMEGYVADYAVFQKIRPYYVDYAKAKLYKVTSTVLIVTVTKQQALKFAEFWTNLKSDPGAFHLLGSNCSTHASEAFRYANILSGGIPGLDTPNNLYNQLKKKFNATSTSYSGFLGFQPTGAGYNVYMDS